MSDSSQSSGKLVWQELLSASEIAEWAESRKRPRKLRKEKSQDDYGASRPGVYRFVFPDNKTCYIGVASDFGTRLRNHICPSKNRKSKSSSKYISGMSIRNAIKTSLGKCYLQYLTIEGIVETCGVELKQDSFAYLFARLLLENWAIMHTKEFGKLHPLNCDIRSGIHQRTKDVLQPAKGNIVAPPDIVMNGLAIRSPGNVLKGHDFSRAAKMPIKTGL